MSEIVASTYEIESQIGSGGGGVVYLATHLRLGKKVVLKADRRKLKKRPESLRREVDALKDLNHTYIPQVYDFFSEGETVYTVMGYIEGESLNKSIKRGERFSQPEIIKWARQLLEALCYLHSPTHGTPPHGIVHSDIKPSNIMRTPYNDICLIDFNIALALGEESVIGRSDGYSSPEHYGCGFLSSSDMSSETDTGTTDLTDDEAEVGATTLTDDVRGSTFTSNKRVVVPDARSDIYSLGATLYHLLHGIRPAKHAVDVTPLSDREYSPQIVKIITKAMDPNPDLRYQTAEEMLYDFEYLYENDHRMLRHLRSRMIASVLLITLLAVGTCTSFIGLKRMEAIQSALILTEYSRSALSAGDVPMATYYALQALPEKPGILIPAMTPEAQKVLTDALGVYDLSDDYKPHKVVLVPGGVIKTALSPDGTVFAAMTLGTLTLIDAGTGEIINELPTVDSALADVVFIDNGTVVYAGAEGIVAYSIVTGQRLWQGNKATTISVSADGSIIAAVYRDETFAIIYDANGNELSRVSFEGKHLFVATNDRLLDPKDNIFALNADGSLLAVSFSDGGVEIFNLGDSEDNLEVYDESDYTHFEGGFNNKYFVFSATNSKESIFVAIHTEEYVQTDYLAAPGLIRVKADESGVYLAFRDKHVKYDPATHEESDPELVKIPQPYKFEYSIDSPEIKISRLESNADKEIFRYDSFYDHDEARISGDGKTVMLFSINGFRLYSIGGDIIEEVALGGSIYDQQYRRVDGGSYLEVIYYNGEVRKYSAVDGGLFSVEHRKPPDESLYEEFFTDTLKIVSPLHGTPVAYDLKSGKLVSELEKDAYLTYVTQYGGFIITEYVSMIDSSRFGMLLDGKTCKTLAVLPNLCDVLDDRLIFNIQPGSLRETRIFSLDELITKAEEEVK